MKSNLTLAGWLMVLVCIVGIVTVWYLEMFVFDLEPSYRMIVGGGALFLGVGSAVMDKLGIDIMK